MKKRWYLLQNPEDREDWTQIVDEESFSTWVNGVNGWKLIHTTVKMERFDWHEVYVDSILKSRLFDPASELVVYRIYQYLNKQARRKFPDCTEVPEGIDYKSLKDMVIKLHPRYTFGKGHLTETVMNVRDYDERQNIEPVIRITEEYHHDPLTGPYEAAQEPLDRLKGRQWWTVEGVLLPNQADLIESPKEYETFKQRRDVGRIRRQNIDDSAQQGFVEILTVLHTSGDVLAAKAAGVPILAALSDYLDDYYVSGYGLPDAIQALTDNGGPMDQILAIRCPDETDNPAPPTPLINAINSLTYGKLAKGLTLKEFLYHIYRADI
jgi:hypothetical protein